MRMIEQHKTFTSITFPTMLAFEQAVNEFIAQYPPETTRSTWLQSSGATPTQIGHCITCIVHFHSPQGDLS